MIDSEIEMKQLGRKHPPNTHIERSLIHTCHASHRHRAAGRNHQVEEYKHTYTHTHTHTHTRTHARTLCDTSINTNNVRNCQRFHRLLISRNWKQKRQHGLQKLHHQEKDRPIEKSSRIRKNVLQKYKINVGN